MKVAIAPDFEHLLPALAESELTLLEQNCLADPEHQRMPPVIVWGNHKNTIIDGHNQHRIRERLRLKIKYARLSFDSRDEAIKHALDVQFGRRNCDASVRAMAYAKLPRKPEGRPSENSANLPSFNELAEKAGVSARTMKDAAKVADKAAAPIVKAAASGEIKVSDAAAIADLPKAEQTKALKAVEAGKAKTLRQAVADSEETETVRDWGDGDSLADVQADLHELIRRVKELRMFARKVLRCEKDEITRPYCGEYSLLTLAHPLLDIAHTIKNDMPVGGTPKKPKLYCEEKAESLANG